MVEGKIFRKPPNLGKAGGHCQGWDMEKADIEQKAQVGYKPFRIYKNLGASSFCHDFGETQPPKVPKVFWLKNLKSIWEWL